MLATTASMAAFILLAAEAMPISREPDVVRDRRNGIAGELSNLFSQFSIIVPRNQNATENQRKEEYVAKQKVYCRSKAKKRPNFLQLIAMYLFLHC